MWWLNKSYVIFMTSLRASWCRTAETTWHSKGERTFLVIRDPPHTFHMINSTLGLRWCKHIHAADPLFAHVQSSFHWGSAAAFLIGTARTRMRLNLHGRHAAHAGEVLYRSSAWKKLMYVFDRTTQCNTEKVDVSTIGSQWHALSKLPSDPPPCSDLAHTHTNSNLHIISYSWAELRADPALRQLNMSVRTLRSPHGWGTFQLFNKRVLPLPGFEGVCVCSACERVDGRFTPAFGGRELSSLQPSKLKFAFFLLARLEEQHGNEESYNPLAINTTMNSNFHRILWLHHWILFR